MNSNRHPNQILGLMVMPLTSALLLAGCTINPAAKESVDQTREVVAELHAAHLKDARQFALMVEEREIELQSLREAMGREAKARARAEADRYKTVIMAEFDRHAHDYLGIQFYNKVEQDINVKFDPIETKEVEALADAQAYKKALITDPSTTDQIITAERNLTNLKRERAGAVVASYLALDAAIVKARFAFETDVNQKIGDQLAQFYGDVDQLTSSKTDFSTFQARMEGELNRLDQSYYSVDHALSDISTYLDSEATARRFVQHAVKGFTETLLDDLRTGQLGGGGTQLAGSLQDKINQFTQKLQTSSSQLQTAAATAVSAAANSQPPAQAPTTTTASAQPVKQ